MADKTGTIQSTSYSIVRTDVYWEATAGTGGCTVKATLKAVNTNGYHLTMTNTGTAYLIIDGEKTTTTGNTYSTSPNGTANFLTVSKKISYTGNKSITIEGYIPANYMYDGTKVSDSKATATIALPKVGEAPTMTKVTSPTTSVISETSTSITVTWEKATSYNNACTYGIGISINGGAYSYVYPSNNIDTTSYTYTISNKTQGTTYQFAVVAANDVGQSNVVKSGIVTLNKLEAPTIADISDYNPYIDSSLSVSLSGGSQLDGNTFYRCAALYYDDEQLLSVVPTSKNNTSVSLTYSTDNYLTKLGTTKYSDTFKIVAWSQNDNGSKSSLVTKTFTVNINTDGEATPTLDEPILTGGAFDNPNTCFIKGISTLVVTSATGVARRAPSGVTLSYSIGISGLYSQGGQSASWSDLLAGTKTIVVTCTDSRGLSTVVKKQCIIQEYSSPTIKSLNISRLDDPNTSASATYELYYSPIYQYTDINTKGNQLNGISSQQYRLNEGTWNDYSSGTEITGLNVDTIYKFQLRCADKVNTSKYTTSSQYTIYTVTHELSLRKSRLGINCVPQEGYALDVIGKGRITLGIESPLKTSSYVNGSKGKAIINSTSDAGSYVTFLKGNSTNGAFTLSTYKERVILGYQSNDTITAGTNVLTKYINLLEEDGTTTLNDLKVTGEIHVGPTFGAGEGTIPGVELGNDGHIELSGDSPYIDFHYNNSSEDYTSRIIADGASTLSIIGTAWIGNTYISGGTGEWIGLYDSKGGTRYGWLGRNGSDNTKFYLTAQDNITEFYFNKNININGREYGVNKVLWSGGWYMNDTQTATLSEAITSQPHGIVLIWSAYVDGASANQNFVFTFVPKRYITTFSGYGVSVFLNNSTGSIVATKYVYISDTTIKGYTNNSDAASEKSSGITVTNNRFVLRQVIGV